ncbi:WecB/TagA/CpsF family glycosyltransferase [Methyloversatilis sp.]|uniref:WecB/TagA/CpsF family glycosyltransferase n=1 Tax=Methyloversatilis sp. TaxID=2569862 RepID=UPI002733198F|nr:WecB/TagA/CpsF family glycosyltransferase [Methyloversatilis sp.]MDP3455949.1 WecB/TagA/CpsF family glycosyltransferase [Methyloversatilis sp.]
MHSEEARRTVQVLSIPIDVLTEEQALDRIVHWAHNAESRYVAICNSHVVVTGSREPDFGKVLNNADMATADGAPVAWLMRRLGHERQPRVSGPDLMLSLCERAAQERLPIYFFGSSEQTLGLLQANLTKRYPGLIIAGACSPPFRKLSAEEDAELIGRVVESSARIVFVGLGCPKQERWMFEKKGRINAVMLGVGAAFDFHAGTITRAPLWMRNCGLEWLHRLLSEPRRLWKRYLVTNFLFVVGAVRQLLARA